MSHSAVDVLLGRDPEPVFLCGSGAGQPSPASLSQTSQANHQLQITARLGGVATNQNQLAGIGRARPRLGRHRRALDKLAKHLRDEVGRGKADLEVDIITARGMADELDRMELDNERSSHTYAMVARSYAEIRIPLHTRLGEGADDAEFASFQDELTAAVRDQTTD